MSDKYPSIDISALSAARGTRTTRGEKAGSGTESPEPMPEALEAVPLVRYESPPALERFPSEMCDLARYVTRVRGLASNSASPTDAWFIQTRDYVDIGEQVLFAKVFVTRETIRRLVEKIPEFMDKWTFRMMDLLLSSLRYEKKVYEHITDKLLHIPVCPLFVRFYEMGQRCPHTKVLEMLRAGGVPNAELALVSNTIYISSYKDGRPAITDRRALYEYAPGYELPTEFFEAIRPEYDFIATEAHDDATTLAQQLADLGDFADAEDLYRVSVNIFQALLAVYAMNSVGVFHNDLHIGNVLVVPTPDGSETTSTFFVDGTPYPFRHVSVVKVFDFDRAYMAPYTNESLEALPAHYAQSNVGISNKDAVKLMCYVRRTFREMAKANRDNDDKPKMDAMLGVMESMEDVFILDKSRINDLDQRYGFKGGCFLGTREHGKMPDRWFRSVFFSIERIISNFYAWLNTLSQQVFRVELGAYQRELFLNSDHVFTLRKVHFESMDEYKRHRIAVIERALHLVGGLEPAEVPIVARDLYMKNVFYDQSNLVTLLEHDFDV